ncbi:hypothetical protein GWI33_004549 [Rhynchophorus ferrugineus]|uniref:RING-type E3 ubiquitin transferase n=1 Tax=Rhynchophorus ferrugineus TaxID=354439 RepID=A0A834IMY3_RHYFE|nr:hypothetical protein GWI33_004549 [Rhynchophorus ferrugineus]
MIKEMIPLKFILFGVTIIATVGFAVYNHFQDNSSNQHRYGSHNRGNSNDDYITETIPRQEGPVGEIGRRRRRRKNSQQDINCTICYENINSPEQSRILMCDHQFHESCINKWFQCKKDCPNCRTPITSS